MDDRTISPGSHTFNINNRSKSALTGVKDVISFDADVIRLNTIMGLITIKGDGLHVSRLTLEKGEVDIDGRIDNIEYSDESRAGKQVGSLLGRLFK